MKKVAAAAVIVLVSLSFMPFAQADELSDLKEQVKLMQQQIDLLQGKIEQLEVQQQPSGEIPSIMQERVAALEQKLQEPYQQGLLSLKGVQFEIGGELELEFVDTQDDVSISEPEPHFQFDKFVLCPVVHFNDDVTFKAELEANQSSTAVCAATLSFSGLPFNSALKIGLDPRFIAASRKTEGYPLIGNAFWRDEEIGLTWSTQMEPLYGMVTISQGLELDTKQVAEDSSYKMLHDNTLVSGYGGIKEVGIGLGFKDTLGTIGSIDILGFSYFNELSDADVAFLKANVAQYDSDDDKQSRFGLNVDYQYKNFNFFVQYINAQDGELDRDGWYVQPSYKIKLPFQWKYCREHDLLVRYGRYNVDTGKDFSKPATWDREELTFAMVTDVLKNIKLKTEYSFHCENTGSAEVDNNELLMQLEVKF